MEATGLLSQVYVDVMLAVNFIMDFFILWAVGRLTNTPGRFHRLVLGALLGASYSLVIFFPESTFMNSLGAKFLCSLAMIILAFAPMSFKAVFRSLLYLYIVSFAMGGAVIAAIYLNDGSPGYIQVLNGAAVYFGSFHYGWLSVGVGVALLMGLGGYYYLRKNWLQQALVHSLMIRFAGKTVYLQALLDTGNQLCDPLSKKPVIVVETGVLKDLLPPSILEAVAGSEEINLPALTCRINEEWSGRLRLIPFNSVGRTHGMMLGLRPDGVEIRNKKKAIYCKDVVIGLINRDLSKEDKYQALLHPALFEEG